MKFQTSIEDLAICAWDFYAKGVKVDNRKYAVLPLNSEHLRQIFETVELPLDGYTRTADVSSLIHVFKKHGDIRKEALRGQVAIDVPRIFMLPKLMEYAELIDTWHEHGLLMLKWSIRLDTEMVLIEEVRTGRKELALKSMRIMKLRYGI